MIRLDCGHPIDILHYLADICSDAVRPRWALLVRFAHHRRPERPRQIPRGDGPVRWHAKCVVQPCSNECTTIGLWQDMKYMKYHKYHDNVIMIHCSMTFWKIYYHNYPLQVPASGSCSQGINPIDANITNCARWDTPWYVRDAYGACFEDGNREEEQQHLLTAGEMRPWNEAEPERERETERERERHREIETQREGDTERRRQRERERETQRDRDTERRRHREKETKREREREKERKKERKKWEGVPCPVTFRPLESSASLPAIACLESMKSPKPPFRCGKKKSVLSWGITTKKVTNMPRHHHARYGMKSI